MSTRTGLRGFLTLLAALLSLAGLHRARSNQDEGCGNGGSGTKCLFAKSVTALQATLEGGKGLPKSVLDEARCLLVFPSVNKMAIGIGGSYGRGLLVCREGAEMRGRWGAPAMYSLDQGNLGVQLGSTATDFVVVVMTRNGAEQILNGKTTLGGNAAVAAGPTGASASGIDADARNIDLLTYSRSKGLFAGVSLEGASLDLDKHSNEALYGRDVSAREVVSGHLPIPDAANSLLDILNKTSPVRK